MSRSILPISLLALSCVVAVKTSAVAADIASMDWSINAPRNLAANAPSGDAIAAFMAKLETKLYGMRVPPPNICSARFANLRHSGNLSLVVSIAGGHGCSSSVIDKTANGFESYEFDENSGTPGIKDVAEDGNLELNVPTDFTSYDGAQHCVASWPVIYAWTGSTYSDVSSRYKNYYERQLAALKKRIAMAEAEQKQAQQAAAAPAAPVWNCQPEAASGGESPEPAAPGTRIGAGVSFDGVGVVHLCSPAPPPAAPEPDRLGLDCDKAEAAKLERFVGISHDAGMSDAIRWADSDNPDDRQFAAEIFADIGTPQALEYLKTLSHDPIRLVAMYAKSGLARLKQGPVAHAVDEQAIPLRALDTHR